LLSTLPSACSSDGGSGTPTGGASDSGGATSGGAASGGATSGGAASGGAASGGAPSGGANSGGSASGGAASGGVASGGGPASGGSNSGGGPAAGGGGTGGGSAEGTLSFFVTSEGLGSTGDLGGLEGADAHCETLAAAVGAGAKTWHAYLSVNASNIDARDRIGSGPWVNALGETLAADLTALHALDGDPELFVDENGDKVPGQWAGSPTPNQHDILTGSGADGTADGNDCTGWTATTGNATVGHSDGLGPGMSAEPPYNSWNSVHTSPCNNFTPAGGSGRLYCFAID
jgi:hypothetical protein